MIGKSIRVKKIFPYSFLFFLCTFTLAASAWSQSPNQPANFVAPMNPAVGASSAGDPPRYGGEVPFIKTINDPIEPFNRIMFGFNDGLIKLIFDPLTTGYRAIAPEPVRKSIRKAGNNLAYPVRLVNTLLQGKGEGALSETGRFLINSTIGLLGFFDPAKRFGLTAYEEDFGQTLGYYGYKPGFYFVLPFFGPSSGRDTLGMIVDAPITPTTYAGGFFFTFNKMSFVIPSYMQLRTVDHDPYLFVRDIAALTRTKDVKDYAINVKDIDPDPSLKSIYITVKDKNFPKKVTRYDAMIPATNKMLPYSTWLQPFPAPLVFVMSGTGSHRMSESTMALAEMLYNDRFSVVTISSAMNWEFMEYAATAAVPGYPPNDARDVYKALDSIYQDLRRRFPGRFNRAKALMGISLGGIHTLDIASFADTLPESWLHFDRYVAIDAPTDLIYAMENLDKYYNAPLEWKPEERQEKIENTLLKALTLAGQEETISPDSELPFNKIESRYLIGLFFKFVLRDVIYSSQKREPHRIIKNGFNGLSREATYDEIVKYSFMDYMNVFLIPYYMNHPNFNIPREELLRNSTLRPIEKEIAKNKRIRAFINENDFFLRPEDFQWYKKTLGDRLTVLSKGRPHGQSLPPRRPGKDYRSDPGYQGYQAVRLEEKKAVD